MITLRRAADRGHFNHGWLDTYHTFSFGGYQDADHVTFRSLRVMNEDRISPNMGFGEHGHRDMEILTWVLEGTLTHRDSLGHESQITPDKVQVMTAGSGIRHSEFNESDSPVHLYQIWLLPREQGRPPRYDEKPVADAAGHPLRLIASPDGRDGSVVIEQDALVHDGRLSPGATLDHTLTMGRHAWVQIAKGSATLDGETLREGDGAALSDVQSVSLTAGDEGAVLLLFELT